MERDNSVVDNMPNIPTRYVIAKFTWPYYHVHFIDTVVDTCNGWQEAKDGENVIAIDTSNDTGIGAAGIIIQNATRMWCEGVDFLTIWRKYPDQ